MSGKPVRAKPSDAGCWIDGHWGHYAVARMVVIAAEHGYDGQPDVALAERKLAAMGPSGAPGLSADEEELLAERSYDVDVWMQENVAPPGFIFEWCDGEYFLSPEDEFEVSLTEGERQCLKSALRHYRRRLQLKRTRLERKFGDVLHPDAEARLARYERTAEAVGKKLNYPEEGVL